MALPTPKALAPATSPTPTPIRNGSGVSTLNQPASTPKPQAAATIAQRATEIAAIARTITASRTIAGSGIGKGTGTGMGRESATSNFSKGSVAQSPALYREAATKNSPRHTGGSRLSELDSILDSVFVSPRLIDQRAYEELSGTLRAIVRDAATQVSSLESSTVEVKGLGSQLREATQALELRLDSAQKAIPAIEQRVTRAERVLEAARSELATRVAQVKDIALADLSIDDATIRGLIETRAKEMARGMVQDVVAEELAKGTTTLQSMIQQQVRKQVEESLAQVHAAATIASSATQRLTAATAGADALIHRIAAASDETNHQITTDADALIRRVTSICESATNGANTQADALIRRITAIAASSLTMSNTEAEARIERLTAVVELVSAGFNAQSQSTIERVQSVTDSCAIRIESLMDRLTLNVEAAREIDATLAFTMSEAQDRISRARASTEEIRLAAHAAGDRAFAAATSIDESTSLLRMAQEAIEAAVATSEKARESMERARIDGERSVETTFMNASAHAAVKADELTRVLDEMTKALLDSELASRLDACVTNARAADEMLAESIAQATFHIDTTVKAAEQRATKELDATLRAVAAASIECAVTDARTKADTLTAELTSELERVQRSHRDAVASATRDMAERLAAATVGIDALFARAAELEESLAVVAHLREATNIATQAAAELHELTAAGAHGEARAQQIITACDTLRVQADAAANRLTLALANSGERAEALAISLDHMRSEYEHMLAASQEVTRLTAPVANELSRRVDEANRMVNEDVPVIVSQAVEGIIAPAADRVREMGDWLTALIAQADQIGRALDRVATRAQQPRQ